MTALSEIAQLSVHRLFGTGRGFNVVDEPTLPSRINEALHDGSRTAMMLGPAEWLILDQEPNGPADPTIGPEQPFIVFDESGAWRMLRLQGADACDIVAQFCPIDVDAVEGGACATHLARHPAIVMPRSAGEVAILVPRSYAASLAGLIRDAISQNRPNPAVWERDSQ